MLDRREYLDGRIVLIHGDAFSVMPSLDPVAEKLSDVMTLAFAAAELAGRWHVEADSRG